VRGMKTGMLVGLPVLLLASLAGVDAAAQSLNADGIQPNEVKRGVAVENAKIDLTMCAPELDTLTGAAESAAIAEIAENPQCRQAILRAQAAGLTRGQIIDILMGASAVPDANPGAPTAAANEPAPVAGGSGED
jgi:hypothetical protein